MANPQPDKFVRVSKELARAFAKVNLSAYEQRILWCIMEKTYGYDKKMDRISYSQFEEFTQIEHRHIGRTIRTLVARNIITVIGEGQIRDYGVQKDYDRWLNLARHDPAKPVPNQAPEPVPNEAPSGAQSGTGLCEEPVPDEAPVPSSTSAQSGTGDQCLTRDQPVPNEGPTSAQIGTEPVPRLAHTGEEILHERFYRSTTKGGMGGNGGGEEFRQYMKQIRDDYPELDIDEECKKFDLYWSEGRRTLKRPKLAFRNWLDKARQIRQRDNAQDGPGKYGQVGRKL